MKEIVGDDGDKENLYSDTGCRDAFGGGRNHPG